MNETWLDTSRDARRAAQTLVQAGNYRSATSRAYYAAFSKVMHELVATAALPMPADREGFGHRRTRRVVESSMPNMAADRRRKLSELLGRLYTLRIDADYKPSITLDAREAREAIALMKSIFEAF